MVGKDKLWRYVYVLPVLSPCVFCLLFSRSTCFGRDRIAGDHLPSPACPRSHTEFIRSGTWNTTASWTGADVGRRRLCCADGELRCGVEIGLRGCTGVPPTTWKQILSCIKYLSRIYCILFFIFQIVDSYLVPQWRF